VNEGRNGCGRSRQRACEDKVLEAIGTRDCRVDHGIRVASSVVDGNLCIIEGLLREKDLFGGGVVANEKANMPRNSRHNGGRRERRMLSLFSKVVA